MDISRKGKSVRKVKRRQVPEILRNVSGSVWAYMEGVGG